MEYLFGLLSYLIGSINFAYVVSYFKKTDISQLGSGNPGTSNVMRNFGKKFAIIVLLGDVLKGLIPVIFLSTSSNAIVYGTLAIIGHIYPVYYKFKGGKGVATFFGVYIALNFQNSIEGYLFENVLLQNINIFFLILQSTSSIDKLLLLIVVLLIFFKHKDNIKRLMQGKENKF